jgi:hypothetical protein
LTTTIPVNAVLSMAERGGSRLRERGSPDIYPASA